MTKILIMLAFWLKINNNNILQHKMSQKLSAKFRQSVDFLWKNYQRYFLQHIKFNVVKFNSMYRHKRSAQYLRTAIFAAIGAYAFVNFLEIENYQNYFHREYLETQYSKLVADIRGDKHTNESYKVAFDIIKKSKQVQLAPLQILALSQLVKKPQINLHAEYLASLK